MSEHSAETAATSFVLTDAERMKISAVVHQNYYMPAVFEVIEAIIDLRAFYVWEDGFAKGIAAERGAIVQNPWARGRSLSDGIARTAPATDSTEATPGGGS